MEVTLDVPNELEETEPIALGKTSSLHRLLIFLLLAIFSNGQVNSESTSKLKCSLYHKKGERNKKKRTLVAKTDHMTYVGTNYESEGTLTTPSFHRYVVLMFKFLFRHPTRYMVGVLDKDDGIMTLHRADLFNMGPYIKGT